MTSVTTSVTPGIFSTGGFPAYYAHIG